MKEKGLSAISLTMMALGTVIGGSFFLGSAVAINAAGPSILIGFAAGGVLVYFILTALSEMTVADPQSGSFSTFADKTYGHGAGFVTGWVYWTGMVLAMSSEATAVSILARNWFPSLPIAFLGSAVIIAVTLLNLLGAEKLSRLESGLAAIKLFAVISFIVIALLLIFGLFPNRPAIGFGVLEREAFMPSGITGLLGSMLIVMFTYAGFEIIGLAASEAKTPAVTIPKSIRYTVISLVGLYIVYVLLLLPLIPTSSVNENTSAIVAALNLHGMGWAGDALNFVLISAILSTMLAAMFGLGRMMRSLARYGFAPRWLNDGDGVPLRGILITGASMLLALGLGLLFPSVYLFLISSGGFSILFSYAVIMAAHIVFRRKFGCPPSGKCQTPGYPYSSIIVLIALFAIIISMPFVPGQAAGLVAGIIIAAFFVLFYAAMKLLQQRTAEAARRISGEIDSFSPDIDISSESRGIFAFRRDMQLNPKYEIIEETKNEENKSPESLETDSNGDMKAHESRIMFKKSIKLKKLSLNELYKRRVNLPAEFSKEFRPEKRDRPK